MGSKADEARKILEQMNQTYDLSQSPCKTRWSVGILAIVSDLEQQLALARKVLAQHGFCDESVTGICRECHADPYADKIHKPDCEWLAAMGKSCEKQ